MYFQDLQRLVGRIVLRTMRAIGFHMDFHTNKDCAPEFTAGSISDHALYISKSIRGVERLPSIIIQGVMQRCGTVYVSRLLALHPALYPYPNEIWEIPLLRQAGKLLNVQESFFKAYEYNIGKIGENDFLPLFGSSFIAYLYSFVPKEKRMLLKEPRADYLNYFYSLYPHENILLLMRDGRDVVNSAIRTWPQRKFQDVCRQWDVSARMVLSFHNHYSHKTSGYWFTKFEDAFRNPISFVKEACKRFNLDQGNYPFDEIEDIPVIGSSSIKKNGAVTWDGVKKPDDFNPISRWRDWPADWKRIFKKVAGQTLINAGYCEDFDW